MKKIFKQTLSVVLSATFILGCAAPAFAAFPASPGDVTNYAVNAADKQSYVEFFNDTVNSLKTDLPYADVVYTAGVPDNGIVQENTNNALELSEDALKYLTIFFDGLFNANSSLFKSLLQSVMGSQSVKNTETTLHRGVKRNKSLPVYGKDYVSALTDANDYQVLTDRKADSEYPSAIKIYFGEKTALEDAKKSSIAALFNLPDGGIDATLIGTKDKETETFLTNVKLDNFTINNARAVAEYAANGSLTRYWTAISYNFTLNFGTAVKLMSAILGVDIYSLVIDTINTITTNLGKSKIDADGFLEGNKITVTYTITIEVKNINYKPRKFGDINDDDKVDSSDARDALRAAVGLQAITSTEGQCYADVDFDGAITAADARSILRMSVGLDPMFTEVPEGKSVKFVIVEEEPEEPEDEDPSDEEIQKQFEGLINIDPTVTPANIAQFIFDTITNFENAESVAKDDIVGIVDIIREIVKNNREANKKRRR